MAYNTGTHKGLLDYLRDRDYDTPIQVGVDDEGRDFKVFGATSGAYMLWDESADQLVLAGTASLSAAGAVTFSGAVDFSGTRVDPGTVSPTAALTLTSAHYGKTIKCGSLCRTVTLPLAAAALDGVRFTILSGRASTAAAGELDVQPTSADAINGGTSGLGYRNQTTADAIGDSVTVHCDGSGWYVVAQTGTWAASTV